MNGWNSAKVLISGGYRYVPDQSALFGVRL